MSAVRRRTERGSAVAVEAALIIPALVLFVALVIFMARSALADQAVGAAASQAARAASLERTVEAARTSAGAVAGAALVDADLDCIEELVSVDTTGMTVPIGGQARVGVTVTCTIHHGLAFPGFPATRTIVETRQSPIDTYRGR